MIGLVLENLRKITVALASDINEACFTRNISLKGRSIIQFGDCILIRTIDRYNL